MLARSFDAIPLRTPWRFAKNSKRDTTVVGIDEAQFFDPEVVQVAQELASKGIRVLAAGSGYGFQR